MAKLLDRAIEFAMMKHAGQKRKGTTIPYITHVIEAMEIVSRMTEDEEVRVAAVLHDTLEDTETTKEELIEAFGPRVADLVAAESEDKRKDQPEKDTWLLRKMETIKHLKETSTEVKMLALGDKLSNIRAMTRDYRVKGEELWQKFNEKDPIKQGWYYGELANIFEEDEFLRATPEFKEYAELCAALFSGTYDGDGNRLEDDDSFEVVEVSEYDEPAEETGEELPVRFFYADAMEEVRAGMPEGTKAWALILDRTEDEDLQDIQLLAATLDTFLRTEEKGFGDVHLQIVNEPGTDDVSWKCTEDGYQLHLCAESGKNWCQAAFQLGYLLTRCLIDHLGEKDTEGIEWAEELISEASTLRLLELLADNWESTPFYAKDPGYAKYIYEYLQEMLFEQGTSALLRCRNKEELKEINERNLFDDRMDESHDLFRAIYKTDLLTLAEVRRYEADDLLLNTHHWRSCAGSSEAVDYVCRLQEKIPGCEIPAGIPQKDRKEMKEEAPDKPEEKDEGMDYNDLNEFDIIENILHLEGK